MSTERVCFTARVRFEQLDAYRRRHEAVWPAMLAELEASGRRNYTVFLGDDGLLVGYYETDDVRASNDYLSRSVVATEWEASMQEFFYQDERIDQSARTLPAVFSLDDQLAVAAGAAGREGARS